ncbi:hypothetical protein [Nocardia sp. NPDC051463]|uniref:hypothetical protein n=1 Tax=Nocardia sp. NPDC051463 TaxID=3154845 RepID=UPI0034309943
MKDMFPLDVEDFDAEDPDYDPAEDQSRTFEVFNPDHSAGVACDRDGEIVGMHIADDALDNGDDWLAAEILKLARLAHAKSRVGLRNEMQRNGSLPYTIDSFDLPTEASYRAMEDAEFGRTTS